MFKPCALIPVYDHGQAVGAVVEAVLKQSLPCVLVDDGSSPACATLLSALASARPETVTLLRHESNRGKGAAVMTGLIHARTFGYSHAFQIDADGQHCLEDIPRFLSAARAAPDAVVAGFARYDESAPKSRLYGRWLTHVWVWINSLSLSIKDAMCGFRIYPLRLACALVERRELACRMGFDIDILVRLSWEGVEIINLPTRVRYPTDGVSHFDLWRDNAEISATHARLFFGMACRLPKLLMRKWTER